MKKQHLFIILSVVLLGFVFGIIQYYQALKTEDVSAVTVGIPNPGHSLAQLECSADSLCIDTTNNRVGIGTANPIVKFQVNGGGSSSLSDYTSTSLFRIMQPYNANSYYDLYADMKLARWVGDGNYRRYSRLDFNLSNDFAWDLNPEKTVMSIRSDGNVGIGTIEPTAELQVSKTVTSSDGTTGNLYLQSPAENDVNAFSEIAFGGSRANVSHPIFLMRAKYNNNGTWADRSLNIIGQDYAGATQNTLMTIKDTGNVGIGTTSPNYTLTVAGTAWVTSGSWSGSDIRWKKNIETLSQSSSLEKVMALNPVNYQWKTDEYPEMKFQTGTQLGFIAQDVEKIIPEVVTTNNEGYKGISYEKIVPVLTSAIQEQEKKIETLSSQNQSLKALVCLDHPLAEVCK